MIYCDISPTTQHVLDQYMERRGPKLFKSVYIHYIYSAYSLQWSDSESSCSSFEGWSERLAREFESESADFYGRYNFNEGTLASVSLHVDYVCRHMHAVLCALWMLRLQWRYYLFLLPIIWSLFGSLAKSCITTVSSSAAVIMNGIIILFVPSQGTQKDLFCLVNVLWCGCAVCVFWKTQATCVLCLNCVQVTRSVA